mmetsp:Transcript_7431/g.16223  ORF Transcript_7431/g.16223 Transcript_7431/m.16223 type:complete len:213 (+) Transcript_7431:699-1337(+)
MTLVARNPKDVVQNIIAYSQSLFLRCIYYAAPVRNGCRHVVKTFQNFEASTHLPLRMKRGGSQDQSTSPASNIAKRLPRPRSLPYCCIIIAAAQSFRIMLPSSVQQHAKEFNVEFPVSKLLRRPLSPLDKLPIPVRPAPRVSIGQFVGRVQFVDTRNDEGVRNSAERRGIWIRIRIGLRYEEALFFFFCVDSSPPLPLPPLAIDGKFVGEWR